ncbi:MAG: hypothetical protein ACE361_24875 [Aureliella sp.]
MLRNLMTLALMVATISPCLAVEPDTVSLRYRSYRKWSINLPKEKWFSIKDGIRLSHANGDHFEVAFKGNDLQFDTDGDGKFDRTIKALVDPKTNVSTTRVILEAKDESGSPFRYAARLQNDANGWEWAPGGAMAGTYISDSGPIPIRLIDQNGNGRFDDIGEDAMVVGNSDNAVLLSSTAYLGDELMRVEYLDQGTALRFTKYDGPTAKIDMNSGFHSKAVLLSAVLVSADLKHSFDVGGIEGSIEVPAGEYRLASGIVGLGQQRVQVVGGRAKPLVLKPDTATKYEWGAPLKPEFEFTRAGNEIQFTPDQVWFFGSAGEQYVGWTPIGKSPEFKVKSAETGAVLEVAILPGSC